MNARECLELVSSNQVQPEQLYHFFATQVSKLAVLYHVSASGPKPFLAKGNQPGSKYVVVFTDVEAARVARVQHPQSVKLMEEPALPFLIKAFRSEADGIVVNPGHPSRLFLVKPHLQYLIREYAVAQFSQMKGPFVPTMDQNLLLVEYQKQMYTVAVYLREEDAQMIARQSGGQVIQHPWSVIFERCHQLGAPAPYLHFGLPEQSYLTPKHAEWIMNGSHTGYRPEAPVEHPYLKHVGELAGDEPKKETSSFANDESMLKSLYNQINGPSQPAAPQRSHSTKAAQEETMPSRLRRNERGDRFSRHSGPAPDSPNYPPEATPSAQAQAPKPVDPDVAAGLKKLERATIEGQGMGNGWEVCRAMAELRRIWVVVDPDGNMVILAGQDQSPIVDFFTSAEHAQRLIEEARQKNPNLPPMVPRLISTKKLYRALAPRKPIVWINRGSPEAWTSIMGDTLPYVLQLMAQMERGQH